MKVGVLLPTFRNGPSDAVDAAREAARHGVDGVFAYDHLWPMGHPERPSLAPFPLLATIAAMELDLYVAPLVARVGLVSTELLIEQFLTLELLAPRRVLAPLGTGDKLSEDENVAYGLAKLSADERRGLVGETARALRDTMTVWIGAGAEATNALARELGAELNLWDRDAAAVATMASNATVNWAGNARSDLESQLQELVGAGATWAVFSPATNIARLGQWRRAHEESL